MNTQQHCSSEVELPFELRSKIFCLCLPSDGRVRPSPTTAPLLLAQVCKHWRAVALATPELWSSVFFEFSPDPPYADLGSLYGYELPTHSTTALVDLWFTRSSGYPLSITLHCDWRTGLPHGLMDILKTRSAQWIRMEVSLSRRAMLELNSVSGPFPCLRILAIDTNESLPHDFSLNTNLYTHSCAPALVSLRLPGLSENVYPFPEEVASPLLTTLELGFGNSADAVGVFNHFPHLRNLVLHVSFGYPPPSCPTFIVAAHLRCLFLDGSVEFVPYVTLPALEHLITHLWDVEGSQAIVSLVERSRCPLHRLTLRRPTLAPATWSALLPVLESVSVLDLIQPSDADYEDAVHPPGAFFPPDDPFPRLQMLTIAMSELAAASYAQFLRVLEARPSLPRARLYLDPDMVFPLPPDTASAPPIPTDVIAGLARLTAHGMHIMVQTPTHSWPAGSVNDADGDYNVFDPAEPLPFWDWWA
ncbi:hypothetical protein C8R45DRAFT_601914 [Mycena sanguinolenta]|nr:hypothetical protein C8R45DRAFT_601914 [Mycena sanguinolenta]